MAKRATQRKVKSSAKPRAKSPGIGHDNGIKNQFNFDSIGDPLSGQPNKADGTTSRQGGFDGARYGRRLGGWSPTPNTTNVIISWQGNMLRRRSREVMRNNAHAVAASESFVGNLIGAGIKPSSLIKNKSDLRAEIMETWLEWTDEADADGASDFYGMQSTIARALFEAGECFVRFRPRQERDGFIVPLQLQMLESELLPYWDNRFAPNGNYIMNGVEFDFRGRRAAYWFYVQHPGDGPIEPGGFLTEQVRVPASEVLHIYRCVRPGQVRGVPLVTPALVKLYFLDQYDDAELDRKKTAALFAGFVKSSTPDDVLPDVQDSDTYSDQVGVGPLEPGTMQTLLPGEDIVFSEPADVGGAYEMFQYRQQLAVFSAMGVPYALATSDLKRSNYSSLRGAIVEYRRRLEQMQNHIMVFQFCRPVWQRWMTEAVVSGALSISASDFATNERVLRRAKWIAPRFEWVDPLKDRQAEKLAVDAGFKSRSDVVEAEGFDPEENDARIAEDKKREAELGLVFPVATAAASQPPTEEDLQNSADEAADNTDTNSQAA